MDANDIAEKAAEMISSLTERADEMQIQASDLIFEFSFSYEEVAAISENV